jgi:hypothetical protein
MEYPNFINIDDRQEARTANTGFASGGVKCKLEALCFYSSVVLLDSLVLRNPPERKSRKRQSVKKLPLATICAANNPMATMK